MSIDLIIGTILGFFLSTLTIWGIEYMNMREFEKELSKFNDEQDRYYRRLLPSAKKKKAHLTIVKGDKDE